jgi:hypothetical protein
MTPQLGCLRSKKEVMVKLRDSELSDDRRVEEEKLVQKIY